MDESEDRGTAPLSDGKPDAIADEARGKRQSKSGGAVHPTKAHQRARREQNRCRGYRNPSLLHQHPCKQDTITVIQKILECVIHGFEARLTTSPGDDGHRFDIHTACV